MTILGHDIDGRPLRAGDEVVLVSRPDIYGVERMPGQGLKVLITQIEPDPENWHEADSPCIEFVKPSGDLGCCGAQCMRKLHNDHRRADACSLRWWISLRGDSMTKARRDGFTVYELDEDGVNRWSFHVQPGTGLDGVRQPDSVIERVAEKAHLAYNNYDRLREALGKMHAIAEFRESQNPDVIAAGELLQELDNLEKRDA